MKSRFATESYTVRGGRRSMLVMRYEFSHGLKDLATDQPGVVSWPAIGSELRMIGDPMTAVRSLRCVCVCVCVCLSVFSPEHG